LRLCQQVDLTLLDHLPGASFGELLEANNQITRRVHQLYLEPVSLPNSSREFVEWVRNKHGRIFEGLGLDFAGEFRTDDVWFGRASLLRPRLLQHQLARLVSVPPLMGPALAQ
jgi:fido (protein-threonine AMPylation protein)